MLLLDIVRYILFFLGYLWWCLFGLVRVVWLLCVVVFVGCLSAVVNCALLVAHCLLVAG